MEKNIDLTDMSTFRLLTTFPSFSFLFYFLLTFGIGIPGTASPRRRHSGLGFRDPLLPVGLETGSSVWETFILESIQKMFILKSCLNALFPVVRSQ